MMKFQSHARLFLTFVVIAILILIWKIESRDRASGIRPERSGGTSTAIGLNQLQQATDDQIQREIAVNRVRGEAFMVLREWEQALKCYQRILVLDPAHQHSQFSSGMCLFNLGRWGEATEEMKNVIRKNNSSLYEQIVKHTD